jgi:hypothetical protein
MRATFRRDGERHNYASDFWTDVLHKTVVIRVAGQIANISRLTIVRLSSFDIRGSDQRFQPFSVIFAAVRENTQSTDYPVDEHRKRWGVADPLAPVSRAALFLPIDILHVTFRIEFEYPTISDSV